MTPEELENELKTLRTEGGKAVNAAMLRILAVTLLPWATALLLVVTIGYSPLVSNLLLFALASVLYVPYEMTRVARQLRKRVEALTDTEDLRVVGTLLDAQSWLSRQGQKPIENALVRLLPRFKASDKLTLSRTQIVSLTLINAQTSQPLALAKLKALEQIGDEKLIPQVTALTKPAAIKDPEVREAAENCLQFLHQRAEKTRAERQLLRASSPKANPGELLRPSIEAAPEEKQLLRASTSGTEKG